MSRLSTSFVLGYHGCDKSVGMRAVSGELDLIISGKEYDWLGPGAYFWESDPQRAQEWAEWKASRGDYAEPFVVGAVIDLGNCLDLLVRENLELLRWAYDSLSQTRTMAGLPMPKNKSLKGDHNQDKLLRYLDCAVITHLHASIAAQPPGGYPEIGEYIEPFDTVRGLFVEGDPVYDGSGFQEKTHTQIAVVNKENIKGIFILR